MTTQEIITRRTLPHWYVPGAAHFVTYRLAGTIPGVVLERFKEQHRARLRVAAGEGEITPTLRQRSHKEFFAVVDRYLDANHERKELACPAIAAMIRGNLYHHDGGKYHLIAYCIMPNHVHVLLQPIATIPAEECLSAIDAGECPDGQGPLAGIMHSLKSYTANQANAILGRSGTFWQAESYDHWVRDEDELARIVEYIAYNPVKKAALVAKPHDWFFCSARSLHLRDGQEAGWLYVPPL